MGQCQNNPVMQKYSQKGLNKFIKYAVTSMQGWRPTMEDAHIIKADLLPDVSVFGVLDGHGGQEIAMYVQYHFTDELQQNESFKLRNQFDDQKSEILIKQALKETFLKMDEMMLTQAGKYELKKFAQTKSEQDQIQFIDVPSQAGCTANIALIHKNKTLYVANSGDSRSVLCSSGKAIEMSIDHKPGNNSEYERIQKAGGFVSDGRVNGNISLSRALGDFDYKADTTLEQDQQLIIAHPEIKVKKITKEDQFLVIGCDGIWETMTNQELINFIKERINRKEDLQYITEDLLDTIVAPDTSTGIGCDNMTAILIQFYDYSQIGLVEQNNLLKIKSI